MKFPAFCHNLYAEDEKSEIPDAHIYSVSTCQLSVTAPGIIIISHQGHDEPSHLSHYTIYKSM